MWISFKRIIRYGTQAFVRDKGSSSATVLIMFITLSLVTALFLARGAANSVTGALENMVDVSVYFKDSAEEQEILDLKAELLNLPELREITYLSKEEALQKFQEKHLDDPVILASLEAVGKNPLLASLNIRTWQIGEYGTVVEFLEQNSAANRIEKIDYQDREPVIRRITALTGGIQTVLALSTIFLALIVVLVTYNTARLAIYNASKEIEVMRLVGAPNFFIRAPFLVQGVIGGGIAALITLLLFLPLTFFLSQPLARLLPGFHLFQYFLSNFFIILLLQLAAGIGLGTLSALIAIRRYLRI